MRSKPGQIDYNSINPNREKCTNNVLIQMLDQTVPKTILDFLDHKLDHLIENVAPDMDFGTDPNITFGYDHGEKTTYQRWNMHIAPEYVIWKDPDFNRLEKYVLQWVSNVHDFKFILTSPRTEVVWHAMHLTPRVHIPLQVDNTMFDIMDHNRKVHSVKLERGKMYLLDVRCPHRVRNLGISFRRHSFFECDRINGVIPTIC